METVNGRGSCWVVWRYLDLQWSRATRPCSFARSFSYRKLRTSSGIRSTGTLTIAVQPRCIFHVQFANKREYLPTKVQIDFVCPWVTFSNINLLKLASSSSNRVASLFWGSLSGEVANHVAAIQARIVGSFQNIPLVLGLCNCACAWQHRSLLKLIIVSDWNFHIDDQKIT